MAEVSTSHTDLLIIGAGPAGMMAAAWVDRFPMHTRIIDKNSARISKGQADGLQARTLEIFDSFEVVDKVRRKGFYEIEICTWTSMADEGMKRTQRVLSQRPGTRRYTPTCINQAIIEQTFVDLLRIKDLLRVERNVVTEKLSIERTLSDIQDAYPITVRMRHLHNMKAKSFQTTGEDSKPHGEKVLNDIEHSLTTYGSTEIIKANILNVPREDKLNRLDIQLVLDDSIQNREMITPRAMLKVAKKIMEPYKIDYKYCDWWFLYKISQKIAPTFSFENKVFLAGDAVHTHSPKLGQGMNVSMQDTYNLVWKLGSVISGSAKPIILSIYNEERRQVALDLLQCDREIAKFYSRQEGASIAVDKDSETPDFGKIRERMYDFLAGVGIAYRPSLLVAESENSNRISSASSCNAAIRVIAKTHLAKNIKLGARIPSFKVLSQAEARPTQLADKLNSDGRWRLLVFAGDINDPLQNDHIQRLGVFLDESNSMLKKFTPASEPLDSTIDVLAIHSSPHIDDECNGWDNTKIFVDDESHHEGFTNVYGKYGICRQSGYLVICRPDQHVGFIGALEDLREVKAYFSNILVTHA